MTMAPVWPVGPPPSVVTKTSILPPVLVTSSGPKIDLRSRSLVKYSLRARPLGGMGVIGAAVALELAEDVAPHLALGQHATHGELDQLLGVLRAHLVEAVQRATAGVARVGVVLENLGLAAGDADLLGIDHD